MGKSSNQKKMSETKDNRKKASGHKSLKIKKTTLIKFAIIFVILAAVTAIFLLCISKVLDSGVLLRKKTVFTSEHYKVDAAMMSYYFYDTFYNELSGENAETYKYYNIKTPGDLKTTKYSDDKTWFDFFNSNVHSNFKSILTYAEAAKSNGIELTDTDLGEINSIIASIKSSAVSKGEKAEDYIAKTYGRGISENDIRKVLEIVSLANRQFNTDAAAISVSDKEINDFYNKNSEKFLFSDYRYYVLEAPVEGVTDTEKSKILADYSAKAKELAACKNVDEFDAWVTSFVTEVYKKNGETLDEETLKGIVSDMTYNKAAYTADTTIGKWIYDNSRKAGDTFVLPQEEHGTFGVVFIIKPVYRETDQTYNIRDIFIPASDYDSAAEAKSAANKILETWLGGDKTEDSFAALAKEHSKDVSIASNGGLTENLMNESANENLINWCTDSTRTVGDTEILNYDSGYHLVYFSGNGLEKWAAKIAYNLKNEKADSIASGYTEKYAVTENQKYSSSIADLK